MEEGQGHLAVLTHCNEVLQVLQQEGQIQKRVHNVFTARLKECTRLLARTCNPPQLLGEEALPR